MKLSNFFIALLIVVCLFFGIKYYDQKKRFDDLLILTEDSIKEKDKNLSDQILLHEKEVLKLNLKVDSLQVSGKAIDQKRKKQEIYYRNEIERIKNFTPTLRRSFLDSVLRANNLN